MESVAREAGVTKPVVYAHFGDKAGLSAAVARHVADDLVVRITGSLEPPQPFPDNVRETVRAFVSFVERDPALFSFLLYPSAGRDPGEDVRLLIETLAVRLEARIAPELGALGVAETEIALRARAVLGLAYTCVDWWVTRGRDRLSRDELVESITTLAGATLIAAQPRTTPASTYVPPPA